MGARGQASSTSSPGTAPRSSASTASDPESREAVESTRRTPYAHFRGPGLTQPVAHSSFFWCNSVSLFRTRCTWAGATRAQRRVEGWERSCWAWIGVVFLVALTACSRGARPPRTREQHHDADAVAQLRHRRERGRHEQPRRGVREAIPDIKIKVVSQPAEQLLRAAPGGLDLHRPGPTCRPVDRPVRHSSTRSSSPT